MSDSWPRRKIKHTFADGIEREVSMLDGLIIIRLEELLRARRIDAIKRHAPANAETIERLINEELREIPLIEVMDHIKSPSGIREAVAEAILEANPAMSHDEALGLCVNISDLSQILGKINPNPVPKPPDPTTASPTTTNGGANETEGQPVTASATSSSSSPASTAGASTPGT